MFEIYYFDTGIWLDFFENRDEPNIPKGKWAKTLIEKIIEENGRIVLSEVIKNEMITLKYSRYEIDELFFPFSKLLVNIYSTKKQFRRAKDLSKKRKIPIFDALHALIARDNRAIMVSLDKHFDKLLDIVKYRKPYELI